MTKICVNIITKTPCISKSSNNLKLMENHSEESEGVWHQSLVQYLAQSRNGIDG